MRTSTMTALGALVLSAAAVPALAADAMQAGNAMATGSAMAAAAPMMTGKTVQITIQNLTTGQPFSPSFFESRGAGTAPLFKLGEKAPDPLVSVAEGGNIGDYSVGAAKDMGATLADAVLAIHDLPGQTRTITIHVDKDHPFIDGLWMLGNTNDGFSGFTGINAYDLTQPMIVEPLGYDAGSEKNNEKKGYLGALGAGNMRDPENGVITFHTGIRGDADAPKAWNWDVTKPVARVTITPVMTVGG